MPSRIIKYIDFQLKGFGYDGAHDLLQSLFRIDSFKPIFMTSFSLATVAMYFEKFMGITPIVYIAFLVLIAAEFYTGIKASIKKGKKIQSRKFGRMIVKMGVYTGVIGILNIFSTRIAVPEIYGYGVNIYMWIYFTVLNLIIIQLILSFFENLSEMGYKETNVIVRVINNKMNRWFELKNEDK